jgi:hypothetical protein
MKPPSEQARSKPVLTEQPSKKHRRKLHQHAKGSRRRVSKQGAKSIQRHTAESLQARNRSSQHWLDSIQTSDWANSPAQRPSSKQAKNIQPSEQEMREHPKERQLGFQAIKHPAEQASNKAECQSGRAVKQFGRIEAKERGLHATKRACYEQAAPK